MSDGTRLSTPAVLTLVSGMLCIGVVGFFLRGEPDPPREPDAQSEIVVDTSTPERTAETFLDAWRKREHTIAARISSGDALVEVEARRRRDEAMSDHERELKAQVWDAMASERLRLLIREAENLDGGRIRLSGSAKGTFLGEEYEREMHFVLHPGDEGWHVEQFHAGEILSDTPSVLRLED